MDPYLLGLRLGGRRVVVVGGEAVATRRIPVLLDAGADIVLISPTVTASLEDQAAGGRIRWEPRRYADGDCAGAWLVCACTDDLAANAAIAAEAEQQRTWWVRADDAQASAAWTPASGRAEDVRGGTVLAAAVPSGTAESGASESGAVPSGAVPSGALPSSPARGRAVHVGVLSGDPRHSA